MIIETGDRVKVVTDTSSEEGVLMPSPEKKIILIKLDNGYNVGFEKGKIKEFHLVSKKKETSFPLAPSQKTTSGLKTVTILHCGGTIASKVDYDTGAVKAKFSPEELLEMFPDLAGIVNLKSRLVANMMSENMRFAHYNLIAKEIEKAVQEGTDGIIITHGTDMLHYTAAALSFVLENLPVPVILVGAQRSSDRGSSDAFLNLQWAAQFIAHSDFAEVAICMHDSAEDTLGVILPGTKSRKMHSSRRDAFKAINARPWAKVKSNGAIEWLRRNYNTSADQKLKLRLFKEDLKIGLLKAHPNMFAEEIKAYSKFDGLILEGTGLGHFPTERYDENTKEHDHIFKEIVKLAGKIPVVMTVQTIFGMVNMNVYTPGRRLIEAGVLGNGLDLTSETAWIKLAWLLSNYSPKEVPSLWAKNFRGEISAQRGYEREFL